MNHSSILPPLVVIGASTGGPKVLADILSGFPAGLSAAIIIIQHVNKEFSPSLVQWLDTITPLPVCLVPEGKQPEAGNVYIAGTDEHLIFSSDFTFSYISLPESPPFHPSIDIFFESILPCRTCKRLAGSGKKNGRCVGVLLSGMGKDGAKGLLALRRAGWHTIAQDKATSVVYGMPKAANELDAADEILPANQIGPAILRALQGI